MPKLITCPSCGSHKARVWTYKSVETDWDSDWNSEKYGWGIEEIGMGTIYLEQAVCKECNRDLTIQVAEVRGYPMWEDPIRLRTRLDEALFYLKSLDEHHGNFLKQLERALHDMNGKEK